MNGWLVTIMIIGLIAGAFGLAAIAGAAVGIAWLPVVAGLIFVVMKFRRAQRSADKSP